MRAIALAVLVAAVAAGAASAVPSRGTLREQRALAVALARGLPVYCAGGRVREVALTFDDGPGPYTRLLLSELRRLRAPATFFLVGRDVPGYEAVVRAETAVGAVGDHTQDHLVVTRLRTATARSEILRGKLSAQIAAGGRVQLLRPPGGHRNTAIDKIARRQGIVDVLWTVDPRDWELKRARAVVRAITSDPRLVPGAIVLLHDSRLSTVRAVPAILADLRRRRLVPVTVPRLLADDPPTLAEQELDTRAGSCVHLFETKG